MKKRPAAHVVHALDRRVRLRAPALTGHRGACERVAQALAAEPGCDVVEVRPLTGSVIVARGEGRLDAEALRARLDELVRAERDEAGHRLGTRGPRHHPGPTRVARAVAHAFAGINADVRRALDDRADIGTVLPVVFAAAGLVEVAVTRKMPAPAWFNLLWWSIRSFMTFNMSAVEEEAHGAADKDAPAEKPHGERSGQRPAPDPGQPAGRSAPQR